MTWDDSVDVYVVERPLDPDIEEIMFEEQFLMSLR